MTTLETRSGRAPMLTADQRAAALRKATAVRVARRAFKDAVARGDHGFASAIALAKADDGLAGIRVADLLTSVPGIGPKRAEVLMLAVGIAPNRRVRGLSGGQAATLARVVVP